MDELKASDQRNRHISYVSQQHNDSMPTEEEMMDYGLEIGTRLCVEVTAFTSSWTKTTPQTSE